MPRAGRLLSATILMVTVAAVGCVDDHSPAPGSTGSAVAATSSAAAPDNASTPGATSPTVTEVHFASDGFELAGEIHVPAGAGPHGAVILVHSAGDHDRHGTPSSGLVRTKFLDAGFAVLSYDKPGSGRSTGEFSEGHRTSQLAGIVADAVDVLAAHPGIAPDRIGVWGLSEAGWVMPRALELTDDIAFMIVVSGGGEDGIEQMVYQWAQRAACGGATPEHVALMEELGPQALKAADYAAYRAALETLLEIPELSRHVGVTVEIQPEEEWRPWPRDIDAFFDPIRVVETTSIPVLAIFGEHDIQVDPVQGAEAYRSALARTGNTASHVEVIPGVDHIMRSTSDRCVPATGGHADRYGELLEEWIGQLRLTG